MKCLNKASFTWVLFLVHLQGIEDYFATQLEAAFTEGISFSSDQSFSSYQPFNLKSSNTTTFRSSSFESSWVTALERPSKQLKTDSLNTCISTEYMISSPETTSSPTILSFGNINSPNDIEHVYDVATVSNPRKQAADMSYSSKAIQGNKRVTAARKLLCTQDHIMAERKRREKLNQLLIALSAIIPNLKKMDKVSVLGDAITYLKELQERVKKLEEQTANKTMKSVVLVSKSKLFDDDNASSDESFTDFADKGLPEIEARISGKNVLIKIHCEKHSGIFLEIYKTIEKLNLTIVNFSALPFGDLAVDITIVAQMDVEFCLTVNELVKNLQSAVCQLM
ncbi:hypothetical protein GIB67_000822 [Kingdonia uniflora]|uniref:BHLH domain-containing protein n=1 Tax=Kingdonia uniflora TaxID=39325 RepID=A0A7J7P0P6_9MAGN|nr:hypothetical protein GIB67_000822 [Kingdonia uniflora]